MSYSKDYYAFLEDEDGAKGSKVAVKGGSSSPAAAHAPVGPKEVPVVPSAN